LRLSHAISADVKPEWRLPLKRAEYVFSISYNPVLMATKSSILILYLRMSPANLFFRYASIFLLILVNTAGIVLTFLNIFQCSPVSAALHIVSADEAKCINLVYLYLCSAPVNVITDLAIVLLPLPILTGIRMERKQKYVVVGTFCTGLFVAVVDVIRIAYLQTALYQQYDEMERSGSSRPVDFGYTASLSYLWSAVEVNTGLICASVLVLKPLMKKINPKAWGGAPPHASNQGRKGSTSDMGSGAGLDLHMVDRGGVVSIGSRRRSSYGEEKESFAGRITEPDAVLRRQGVMHDLRPIDEETLEHCDDEEIRAAAPRKMSDSPFHLDTFADPGPPTRKVDLSNMDFMDFLALSEAEIDGMGALSSNPMAPDDQPDEGYRIVKQPAAVCSDMMLQGQPRRNSQRQSPLPPRKRRMTILTLGSAVSGVNENQAPDTAFSDFVNLTSTKPLTQLTQKEAFWPILSGR
jgi:hypothetical protein